MSYSNSDTACLRFIIFDCHWLPLINIELSVGSEKINKNNNFTLRKFVVGVWGQHKIFYIPISAIVFLKDFVGGGGLGHIFSAYLIHLDSYFDLAVTYLGAQVYKISGKIFGVGGGGGWRTKNSIQKSPISYSLTSVHVKSVHGVPLPYVLERFCGGGLTDNFFNISFKAKKNNTYIYEQFQNRKCNYFNRCCVIILYTLGGI